MNKRQIIVRIDKLAEILKGTMLISDMGLATANHLINFGEWTRLKRHIGQYGIEFRLTIEGNCSVIFDVTRNSSLSSPQTSSADKPDFECNSIW